MVSSVSWTVDEWDTFTGLLEEWWPGEFDDQAGRSWRLALDAVEPRVAVAAVKRLLHEGRRFRPSVSEVLAAARTDPGRPTFDEALALVRHCLRARPARDGGPVRYGSPAERDAQVEQAVLGRAETVHPLVRGFIVRQGVHRLRMLRLSDPEHGELRRRELEQAWQAHVEAFEGRETAALAAGDGAGGLHRLDPLASISAARRQITEGEQQ